MARYGIDARKYTYATVNVVFAEYCYDEILSMYPRTLAHTRSGMPPP